MTALACRIDQPPQDRPSRPAPAPILNHRHAADVTIGQQPAGGDGASVAVSERVDAVRVVLVHLELWRHALLLDEHGEADALRLALRALPVEQSEFEHRAKSIITA